MYRNYHILPKDIIKFTINFEFSVQNYVSVFINLVLKIDVNLLQ